MAGLPGVWEPFSKDGISWLWGIFSVLPSAWTMLSLPCKWWVVVVVVILDCTELAIQV